MLALVAVFLLVPDTAAAWSARAHAVIAEIASRLVTPPVTAAVGELLRDDLRADGRPSGRVALAEVASWPDELRATAEQRATGVYHYDDIPVCGSADRQDYCRDGRCASAWLTKQIAILKDRSKPARARNEALKWVTHLLGDLHQPLHASDHDDRGGNDVPIAFLGATADRPIGGREQPPYNLHTAWDRLIPDRVIDTEGGADAFVARLPSRSTREAWDVGTVLQWTQESHGIAVDFVYGALPAFDCAHRFRGLVELNADYESPAESIVAAQLRKAGVRLARVLEEALGTPWP